MSFEDAVVLNRATMTSRMRTKTSIDKMAFDRTAKFAVVTYFPAMTSEENGFLVPVVYSSHPISYKGDRLKYSATTSPGGRSIHLASGLLILNEMDISAIKVYIDSFCATERSYLSILATAPVNGDSYTLAVVAALLGAPPAVYSGVVNFDATSFTINAVQNIPGKRAVAVNDGRDFVAPITADSGFPNLVGNTNVYDRSIKDLDLSTPVSFSVSSLLDLELYGDFMRSSSSIIAKAPAAKSDAAKENERRRSLLIEAQKEDKIANVTSTVYVGNRSFIVRPLDVEDVVQAIKTLRKGMANGFLEAKNDETRNWLRGYITPQSTQALETAYLSSLDPETYEFKKPEVAENNGKVLLTRALELKHKDIKPQTKQSTAEPLEVQRGFTQPKGSGRPTTLKELLASKRARVETQVAVDDDQEDDIPEDDDDFNEEDFEDVEEEEPVRPKRQPRRDVTETRLKSKPGKSAPAPIKKAKTLKPKSAGKGTHGSAVEMLKAIVGTPRRN